LILNSITEKKKAIKTDKAEILKPRRVLWNTREALIPKKNNREKWAKISYNKPIFQTKTEYT
jgi:hypothetical protein